MQYYNADGSQTADRDAAIASWRADKEFNGNWGLDAINAEAAYILGITGRGSRIGVIDQPVWGPHPEFAGTVDGKPKLTFLTTSGTYVYADPHITTRKPGDPFTYDGTMYVDGRGAVADHGTHVGGIAAGNRDTKPGAPGVMQGVAYNGLIFAADNGDPGPEDGIVKGNDGSAYAAAWQAMIDSNVDVITNSWGIGIDTSKAWRFAEAAAQYREITAILGTPEGGAYDGVIKAAKAGIVIEFSAGNDYGADPDAMAGLAAFIPELEENWVATMSVQQNGTRSGFSSNCGYAKYFCVAAPGSNIYSATVTANTSGKQPGDLLPDAKPGYGNKSGTSMAGPFVSGAIGLLKERYSYLSNGDLNAILKTTSTDLGAEGIDEIYGWGLINLDKAMNGPGQFLGRFDANLGSGVSDIWSNDISDAALQQRQLEEKAEIDDWEVRKAALQAALKPVPELTPASAEQIAAIAQGKALLQAAIIANTQGVYTPAKLTAALAAANADPAGKVLLALYEAYKPGWTGPYSQTTDFDSFIAGRDDTTLADASINVARELILRENAGSLSLIETMETVRIPVLLAKGEAAYLGGLTKAGAGKLTLTGDNTYRGDTIVNGGELAIGQEGSVASASVVNAAGLLTVDGTTAAATVNTGGRLKVNTSGVTGDVTLNGGLASIDGHSGNTTVNKDGILDGDGTVSALTVNGGGAVALTASQTLHVGGIATFADESTLSILANLNAPSLQAGSVTLGEGAALNLSGVNALNETGIVLIDTASGIDGAFGTISIGGYKGVVDYMSINTQKSTDQKQYLASFGLSWTAGNDLAHGTFTLANANDSFTVGAALADQQPVGAWDGTTLTKAGAGKLTLTGDNTYRGDTIVNGGELAIGQEGSVASASVVNAAGLLTVDGTTAAATVNTGGRLKVNTSGVTGDVTLNGGLASIDGHSGNTTVNKDGWLFGNGFVDALAVNAGGAVAPGNSIGKLNVTGDASFAKGSQFSVQMAQDGRSDALAVGGKADLLGGLVVVQTENGDEPLTIEETLALLNNSYTILTADKGVTGTFEGVTPSYYFIGAALSYNANDVQLMLTYTDLAFADVGETRNQKSVGAAIQNLGAGNLLHDTVATATLYANLAGDFDSLSGEVHASLKGVLAEDSRFVRDAATRRIRVAIGEKAETPAAIWGEAYGSRSKRDGDGNAADLSRDVSGLIAGLDGEINDTWRVGMLAGYGDTSLDTVRGQASAETYQVGIYGGARINAFGLSFGGSLAHHEIETDRMTHLVGIAEANEASYSAKSAQIFGEASYRIDTPYVALEPFAGAAYVHLKSDDFSEAGGVTALSAQADSSDLTTTTLGLRASHAFVLGETTTLTAHGMVGWRHAFGDTTPEARFAFAGGGGFSIDGLPVAEDMALVEAGFDVNIGASTTIGVSYNGQFSSQAHDNAVKADLTVKF